MKRNYLSGAIVSYIVLALIAVIAIVLQELINVGKKSKTWVNTEMVDTEQEEMNHGKTYTVKTKKWKNGLLIKVLDKKLFKDKKEAEKYYEQQESGKHITVELSLYLDGNERSLKNKGDK